MKGIDDADITTTNILHHHPDGSRSIRRRENVDVIAHKRVGMNRTTSTRCRFRQAFEIKPPVRIPEKTRGAVVAALDYVLRYTG